MDQDDESLIKTYIDIHKRGWKLRISSAVFFLWVWACWRDSTRLYVGEFQTNEPKGSHDGMTLQDLPRPVANLVMTNSLRTGKLP